MTPLDALATSLAGRPVRVQVDRRPATTSSGPGWIRLGADLSDAELERLAVAAHAVLLSCDVATAIMAAGIRGDEARGLALNELLRAVESRPFDVSQPLARALTQVESFPMWLGDPTPGNWTTRRVARRRLSEHTDMALSLGPLGKLAARLGGGRPTSASGAGIDGAAHTSTSAEDPPPTSRLIVATGGADRTSPRLVEDHVVLVPEWDDRAGLLRHDYCAVRVRPRHPNILAPSPRPADVRRMQRALLPLRRGLGAPQPNTTGEELDVDAVVRRQAEVRAGWDDGREGRLWRARERSAPRISLLTLVDHSGSAAGDEDELVDTARATATWLDAAGDLGISSSAFTFRSHGRRSVELTPVVREGQRLGRGGRSILADQERSGFTRLGAVLRYGTRRLIARSAGLRQVILLVSDGFPFDDEYRGRRAEADVERALTEATEAGVGVVWVRPRRVESSSERSLGSFPHVVAAEVIVRPHELTAAVLRAAQ
jgi:nitric oxide reductase NorD protein